MIAAMATPVNQHAGGMRTVTSVAASSAAEAAPRDARAHDRTPARSHGEASQPTTLAPGAPPSPVVSHDLSDFVRLSSIFVSKAKQGASLSAVAAAIERQPDVRRAQELQVGRPSTRTRETSAAVIAAARDVAAAITPPDSNSRPASPSQAGARIVSRFFAPLGIKSAPVIRHDQDRWRTSGYVIGYVEGPTRPGSGPGRGDAGDDDDDDASSTSSALRRASSPSRNPALLHPPSSIKRDTVTTCHPPPPSPAAEKATEDTLTALHRKLVLMDQADAARQAAVQAAAAQAAADKAAIDKAAEKAVEKAVAPAPAVTPAPTSAPAPAPPPVDIASPASEVRHARTRSPAPSQRTGLLWRLHASQKELSQAAAVQTSAILQKLRAPSPASTPAASAAASVTTPSRTTSASAMHSRGLRTPTTAPASRVGSVASTLPSPMPRKDAPASRGTTSRSRYKPGAVAPLTPAHIDAALQRHQDLQSIRHTLQSSNISSLIRNKGGWKSQTEGRTGAGADVAGGEPAGSDADDDSGALQKSQLRTRKRVRLTFHTSDTTQLFYGSTIALESLDGWFLTVHPKTGIVSVREPEPRWAHRGTMPFRRQTLPGGDVIEPPIFLFKVMHMRQPQANGPVRTGDPVWLQIVGGRGDKGWTSGSVLAPYMQQAVQLDARPVDILGHPLGWTVNREAAKADDKVRELLERAAATHPTFGLPESEHSRVRAELVLSGPQRNKLIEELDAQAARLAVDRSMRALVAAKPADLPPVQRRKAAFIARVGSPAAVQAAAEAAAVQAAAEAAAAAALSAMPGSRSPVQEDEQSGGTFITSVAHGSSSSVTLRSDASASSLGARAAGSREHAESVPTLPVAPPLNAAGYINTMVNEITMRSRLNPLDLTQSKLGIPRPIVAFVPTPGSANDYLEDRATSANPTGIYRPSNEGYDTLYETVNQRPLVCGKWRLQLAAKEVTADGLVIGGMGVEGTLASTMAGRSAAPHEHAAAVTASNRKARVRTGALIVGASSAEGGDGSAPTATEALITGATTNVAKRGEDVADVEAKRRALRRMEDERDFIMNMSAVYLEQEWFYVSTAPATADNDVVESLKHSVTVSEADASHASRTGSRVTFAVSESARDRSPSPDMDAPSESPASGSPARVLGASQPNSLLDTTESSMAAQQAPDSSIFVHQPDDGCSGGNRRPTHLAVHAPHHAGPFKVERRGVFRIRVVTSADGASSIMTARDDNLTLRARSQLRTSTQIRLGKAATVRELANEALDGATALPEDYAYPDDETAAANIVKRFRQQVVKAEQDARLRFLVHEEHKFGAPVDYYAARLQDEVADVRRERDELEAAADRAQRASAAHFAAEADNLAMLRKQRAQKVIRVPSDVLSASRGMSFVPVPRRRSTSPPRDNPWLKLDVPGASRSKASSPSSGGMEDDPLSQMCPLCRGKAGIPIFAVNLCAADAAVVHSLAQEADRRGLLRGSGAQLDSLTINQLRSALSGEAASPSTGRRRSGIALASRGRRASAGSDMGPMPSARTAVSSIGRDFATGLDAAAPATARSRTASASSDGAPWRFESAYTHANAFSSVLSNEDKSLSDIVAWRAARGK